MLSIFTISGTTSAFNVSASPGFTAITTILSLRRQLSSFSRLPQSFRNSSNPSALVLGLLKYHLFPGPPVCANALEFCCKALKRSASIFLRAASSAFFCFMTFSINSILSFSDNAAIRCTLSSKLAVSTATTKSANFRALFLTPSAFG